MKLVKQRGIEDTARLQETEVYSDAEKNYSNLKKCESELAFWKHTYPDTIRRSVEEARELGSLGSGAESCEWKTEGVARRAASAVRSSATCQ